MTITRRLVLAGATALLAAPAAAQGIEGAPAPFDGSDRPEIALVRYLSTGDFFQAYLSGVERQAEALGMELRVFDSRQDAALQADMMDQAIRLGVDGIIVQHGLTESMKPAVQRALDAGIPIIAFDVNVENEEVPQIEQSDRDLARLALEQAIADHGEDFTALGRDRRDEPGGRGRGKRAGARHDPGGRGSGRAGHRPPTLITQDFLNENDIANMEDLAANMPQFSHADVAMPDWMPEPAR